VSIVYLSKERARSTTTTDQSSMAALVASLHNQPNQRDREKSVARNVAHKLALLSLSLAFYVTRRARERDILSRTYPPRPSPSAIALGSRHHASPSYAWALPFATH